MSRIDMRVILLRFHIAVVRVHTLFICKLTWMFVGKLLRFFAIVGDIIITLFLLRKQDFLHKVVCFSK